MKTILIIAYLIALVFGKWCGKPFQWFFELCASNAYASILLFGFLVLGIVRLINYFTGELNVYGLNNPFRGSGRKTTQSKRKE